MDKVAVVILNWNGLDMLSRFLPGVLAHSRPEAAVYVADNGSTDASVEMLRREFPDVGLVLLEGNLGFALGYNRALESVDAEYFVLLNSDVEVTPCWLAPMVDFMDSRVDVAACQPKLLSHGDRSRFEYAGASGGYLDRFGYPFCRGRVLGTVEEDSGQYDDRVEVHWASGACMMVRASDFRAAGGFEARFFAHQEEIDLCWRLRSMGRRIYCVPESVVYHVGGGTLPMGDPRKSFLNFRNNLAMLHRNLPEGRLRKVMLARWFLDHAAALAALLSGNIGEFRSILRARRAYRKWRGECAGERRALLERRVEGARDGLCGFSILWQYYARGKRRYSDIAGTDMRGPEWF